MGLITEFVEITIGNMNKKHFINLGYEIPAFPDYHHKIPMVKKGTKIIVKTSDLLPQSKCNVLVKCDGPCKQEKTISWHAFAKREHCNDGEYYCQKCAHQLFGLENIRLSKLKKGKSFGDWCLEEGKNELLERWDYNMNKMNPFNVSFTSNKKAYFICSMGHESKSTGIRTITVNNTFPECLVCNSLGEIYPQSFEFWSEKNTKTPYDYPKMSSSNSAFWKCENEIHEDYFRKISESVAACFRCPKCSKIRDESYLQEKVRLYINTSGYTILHENYCSIRCESINPNTNSYYRYDNEIYEISLVIEVMGIQHYKTNSYNTLASKKNGKTPQENLNYQKKIDEYKKQYALSQNYAYLAIPYWEDDDQETWRTSIDNAIQQRIYDLNNQY